MLELDGSIWLRAGAENWGGKQRIALLEKVGELGSITAAAKAMGLSYKAAWDAIDAMNNLAGEPLMTRVSGGKGGGGTVLTDRARQLIATFQNLEREHRRFVEQMGRLNLDGQGGAAARDVDLLRRFMLRTSARNKLFCTVVAIEAGVVNSLVELRLPGGQQLKSSITHESVEALELVPEREVIALVKASSVVLAGEPDTYGSTGYNVLAGKVARIKSDDEQAEVAVEVESGGVIVSTLPAASAKDLSLAEGTKVCAAFRFADVILGVID